MTAAIATTLRKTLVSAAIAAAMVVVGTGTANATVYEYSFFGVVESATTNDGLGNLSSGAYGLGVGSPITGRLWFDSSAQPDGEGFQVRFYRADWPGLSIDGLDLSSTPSGSARYAVADYAVGADALTHSASWSLPNGVAYQNWTILAPASWLNSSAMPDGLPLGDLWLPNSWGSLSRVSYFDWQEERMQFRFTSISPVPEPSTYALMLAGLVLVGGIAARRRSDQGN